MKDYFNALFVIFNSLNKFYKSEKIRLSNSIGNISARTFFSHKNIPIFYNSAMDGYAIRHYDTLNNLPKTFIVLDTLIAGENLEYNNLDGNFVIEIMTGARLPFAFDSVIKFEDVIYKNSRKFEIIINRVVKLGENVRKIGEDFGSNDFILGKGDVISSSHIMSLSVFNFNCIHVLEKPKVYLLCTGDEIIESSNESSDYKKSFVVNSTSSYIINFFKKLDVKVIYLGLIKDNSKSFLNKLKFLFLTKKRSLVITTGAVSKGRLDFIPSALKFMGANVLFHGVKIKPGKPILFAKFLSRIYFFCLPGNPVSSVIGLRFFIYPFLRYLMGQSFEKPLKARLVSNYIFYRKVNVFLKAYSFFYNSILYVKIIESQESFKIRSILKSNSFVFLKLSDVLKKGELLDVFFYYPNFL